MVSCTASVKPQDKPKQGLSSCGPQRPYSVPSLLSFAELVAVVSCGTHKHSLAGLPCATQSMPRMPVDLLGLGGEALVLGVAVAAMDEERPP